MSDTYMDAERAAQELKKYTILEYENDYELAKLIANNLENEYAIVSQFKLFIVRNKYV